MLLWNYGNSSTIEKSGNFLNKTDLSFLSEKKNDRISVIIMHENRIAQPIFRIRKVFLRELFGDKKYRLAVSITCIFEKDLFLRKFQHWHSEMKSTTR